MPLYDDLEAFAATLPKFGSLLALDVSKRRLGFAGTDMTRLLATPVETWQRRKFDADLKRIAHHLHAREAVALVVGFPLEADGGFGPRAQAAKDTARAIDAAIGLPIWLQDERWTTAEAKDRRPSAAGEDAMAACVILEDTLRALERLADG